MTIISVSVDDDILTLIDHLISQGLIKNRSEAIRGGLFQFVKSKLLVKDENGLRDYLKTKYQKKFSDADDIVQQVRAEE